MPDTKVSSHLDADAITAAQEEPTVTVGNLLYRGRLLSIEEWLPFWERSQHLDAEAKLAPSSSADVAARRLRARTALYRDYLTAVFPRRRYRWWAPDPVKHLMALPFTALEASVAFFFILQAQATFGKDALKKSSTDTISSSSKTPPSPADARPEA